jgi:hypothetical protein
VSFDAFVAARLQYLLRYTGSRVGLRRSRRRRRAMPVRARSLAQRPRLLAVAWLSGPEDVQCPLDVRTHR